MNRQRRNHAQKLKMVTLLVGMGMLTVGIVAYAAVH